MAKNGNGNGKGGRGKYDGLRVRKPANAAFKRAGIDTGKMPSDNRIRRVEGGMQRRAAAVADGKW